MHVLNTITIHSSALGCDTVIGPQTRKAVSNTNGASDITVTANVSNIVSTSPNGTSGTYSGSSTVEREGGGFIRWDA